LNTGYVAIKNWEYRSLGLTPKCDEILKGGKKLFFRKQEAQAAKKSKKESREVDVNHGRDDLFAALKALRANLAREQGVPPYVIFADKALHEMCTFLPRNADEFLMINGVGQSKHEKYGEKFLGKIKEFL
jgi:ATP-dependent DNA helicase RecQ